MVNCPHCNRSIDPANLRIDIGLKGGAKCPECNGVVRPVLRYKLPIAIVSALLAGLVMVLVGVRNLILFALGTGLLWIPISMVLNGLIGWGKPHKLKAAPPPSKPSEPFTRLFNNRRQ